MLCVAGITATSCSDFLETTSPSVVDAEFVFSNMETSRAAMDGVYEEWRAQANSLVFGAGLFYAADVAGSDIERHPEGYANQPGRHIPETFYENGAKVGEYGLLSYQKEGTGGAYGAMFAVIGKANAIINAVEETSGYADMIAQGKPTDISQLFGEAMAARATAYRELIKYFGDVPYQVKKGVVAHGLASRDSIYEAVIADLKMVEPLMYPVGEGGVTKNQFSRTYVQALIGRLCLEAAGYQTRRVEFVNAGFYKNLKGEALSFEKMDGSVDHDGATYGRRADWKSFYETAKTYYEKLLENPGSVKFHSTDPRAKGGKGQEFGNPYQYFFQQMLNLELADESIYEYAMTQGLSNERPYSSGRPSTGGNNQFPCKAYGQARINPAFYYEMFDPADMRRDVSVTVTGTDGKGSGGLQPGTEVLLGFAPNSQAKGGGLSMNKWDENRMANPYTKKQRNSGINGPYMRISEVYLSYAEVCAVLGQENVAKEYLAKIRERSFPTGKAKTAEFIASKGSLFEAIIDERGFEYAGEGDRRWTLIRTGLIAKKVKEIKELTKAMLDGLQASGSYTFTNGNVISNYVWTKHIDARTEKGYRLTTQCPAGAEADPVLYPSWRGVNDDWDAYAGDAGKETCYTVPNPTTNLAIRGLFTAVSDADAAVLEADGYKKVDWGKTLVEYYDEYYTFLFKDYDYKNAPIYLWPFTPNTIASGGFTNGYGFKQE